MYLVKIFRSLHECTDEAAIKFTVKNVFNITKDVVDWFGLGTQLEMKHSRLKKIRREIDTEDGRRYEMISYWLNTDPEASWEKLSEAMVRVDHRISADKVNKLREILLQGEPIQTYNAYIYSVYRY